MDICYLGHAGFCVETERSIIIMDPWFSDTGAFDAAWFPYPKNQFMAAYVRQIVEHSSKDLYLFISHEHQDHFDIDFITSLPAKKFRFILADYDYPLIQKRLRQVHYPLDNLIFLKDKQCFSMADGEIRLMLIDSEMNCDAAILVQTSKASFLNLNDCKIYDRLADFTKRYDPIDILTAQFSGASWYPTAYQLPLETLASACDQKVSQKFQAVKDAIKILQPKLYIPSAGPPCFLDPSLIKLNFLSHTTYPRAEAFLSYLDQSLDLNNHHSRWQRIEPGEQIEVSSLKVNPQNAQAKTQLSFEAYIQAYAAEKSALFIAREADNRAIHPKTVFEGLKAELTAKLAHWQCPDASSIPPLYWQISDYPDKMYRIDLTQKSLQEVTHIDNPKCFYRISSPAWQVAKVLCGDLSWPDFALTFRMTLEREPNEYNTLVHGFLILAPEKIQSFCKKFTKLQHNQERITLSYQGQSYSILRYCPHQGGDLSLGLIQGSSVICPRHQWAFDLLDKGRCKTNQSCIDARLLEST